MPETAIDMFSQGDGKADAHAQQPPGRARRHSHGKQQSCHQHTAVREVILDRQSSCLQRECFKSQSEHAGNQQIDYEAIAKEPGGDEN